MSTSQQANLLDLANLLVGPQPSATAAQQLLLVAAAAKAASPLPTSNTATTTTTSHSVPARRGSAPDPPGDSCASPVVHLLVNERKRSLVVPSTPTPMTTEDDEDDNCTAVTASPVAKKPRRERSWDEMFGALVSYKARNDSTDVPVNYPDDPELALWVKQQRRRKFLLGTEERYKLDLISFEWDGIPSSTSTATSPSTTAKAASSALISPDVDVKVVPKLASLALRLPSAPAAKATTKEVKTVMTYKPTSRNIFDALDEYKQRHRPASPATPPASPPRQVPAHIQEKISAKLSAAIATLSTTAAVTAAAAGTGIVSEAQKHWNTMFAKLQAHKTRHGHCNVQLSNPEDPALGLWVLKQRSKYQQGTIPKAHKALLDALGFERDGLIGAAATAAAAADAAAAAATRTRLPHSPRGGMVTPDSVGSLTPSSSSANDKVSGPGDTGTKERKRVRTFEENFNALLEYKKVHGNVDVPQKYEKDRKLGIWVKNVRQHPQRHTEEQRARLDSIGFKWRKLQLDQQWNDAFKQLLEYKEKYGDCNVPSRWKQCPALARWVHTQRTMYRRDKLLKGRKTKLEEVGFVWDCNALRDDEAFQENFERLKEYKEKMGHCNIPNKYRRDRPLGRWAAKMRDLYLVNDLDEHRKKALVEIGFVWEAPAEESGGSESDTAEYI